MSEWQHIDTAPKDCRILVSRLFQATAKVWIAKWEDDRYAQRPRPYFASESAGCPRVGRDRENQPTHWMPIPEFRL